MYEFGVDFVARCIAASAKETAETNTDNILKDEAALIELIDSGPKNRIHFDYPDNFAGLTFTKNADGSVTVNGTATATGYLVADQISPVSPDAEMVLTGCPAGGGGESYAIVIATREPEQYFADIGNGWSGKIGGTISEVRIVFIQGATIDNLTFKPMLCTAEYYAISPKFVQYRPSYQELYEMVKDLQAQLGNTFIRIITKEEYDSITHDANTIYYVRDGDKIIQYIGDVKLGTGSLSGGIVYISQSIPSTIVNVEEVEE